ncbi:hypothetical protein KAR91_79915 [Candidatus Pacearchaeota archaeon]|nr:hypothetical protein [Candidatus Pacearchaeota archaeon]
MSTDGELMEQLRKETSIINSLISCCQTIMESSKDPDTIELSETIHEFLLKKYEVLT